MLYQMLNGQHWRHIYIVGDLHGCRSLLDAQLIAQSFDIEKDLLVSVGDLIDRGPDSLGCLRLLDAPWFRSVRGNHEEMALQALAGGSREMWQRNGGNWFWSMKGAAMVSARHALKRCSKLPLIVHLQLGERVVVVAHADYPADHYAYDQPVDEQQVVWSRARIGEIQRGVVRDIAGADAFYFGHTPLDKVLDAGNVHYIDTGAVFGNTLTLVQVQ